MRDDLLTLMMTGRKEGEKVTVKELVKVCSNAKYATIILAYDNVTDASDEGNRIGVFPALDTFEYEFGDCEVLAVYPMEKDYLYVQIKAWKE